MKMYNLKIYKIEIDLLYFLYNDIGCEKLTYYFKCIKKIEREFTGVGAFISFEFYNEEKLRIDRLKDTRLIGPVVHSDEFEHEALVSYVFNNSGVLDYIEFEFGMRKKKYPSNYSLIEANVNVIENT